MMSLFENSEYSWRDTYFVLFRAQDRPTAETTLQALETLGPRYQIRDLHADEQGRVESFTLLSPDDFAAMDISFIAGEEVEEQVETLTRGLRGMQLSKEEEEKRKTLRECNARFDIYHFEQVVSTEEEDDEGFLDPGALLIVLQCLGDLCHGVGVDPQTGTFM
jgi:hypothetical protein